MLIAMAGLPGTGKSTLAERLSVELPGLVLDKDRIRAALFSSSEIEYSTQQDDLCMRIMLQAAEYVLSKGPDKHVILDGRTFSRRYQVDEVRQFARRLGMSCVIIECVCADSTVKKRLDRDVAESRHPAENRDYGMYLTVRDRFEPISEPKLVIDTDESPAKCVQRALDYLLSEIRR